MSQNVVDAADASALEIVNGDDVSVVGADDERVYLVFDDEGNGVERDGDTIRIRANGDLNVRLPRRLHLRVNNTSGDLRIYDLSNGVEAESVSGDVRIQSIRGDVTLDDVAGDATIQSIDGTVTGGNVAGDAQVAGCRGVELRQVSGDLRLQAIDGTATIANASDDATVESCTGEVRLEHVGDDLTVRNLPGGFVASHVGGDLRLETPFAPGRTYEATCGGSAQIILMGNPAEASVDFELRSGEGVLDVRLPLADVRREASELRGRLGNGEATVRVHAGEHVRLSSVADRGAFEFESGFEGMMEGLAEGIEAGIRGAFDAVGGADIGRFGRRMENLSERITRQVERELRRADEIGRREGERARHRAEQAGRREAEQAERNARRFERRGGRWQWGPPGMPGGWPFTPPTPPAPPPAPTRPRATEEERLVILRMLAEEKISTEEAARLLEALGG